ncbi:MAG: glycosyltransferase family 4 protein [Saprospiraceae bacterium]|nr:glycosyltransferase family 4 protein [Saprospiraceae bacterium]
MRIAINTRFLLSNNLEGIGWFTWEVAKELVANHPEHHFVFLFDRPFNPIFIPGGNVEGVIVQPPARHAVLWWWWFEMALPSVLKRYKIDVFLSPDSYCSLRSKVPTVMVCHDIAFCHYPEQVPFHGRVFYKHYVPKYLQRAERIISVSEFTKQDIIQQYQTPAEKIAVACNGVRAVFHVVDETEKQKVKQQYSEGQDYFFYLGSVHPRKNVARLVQAFDRFKTAHPSQVKLLIGGRLAWQTTAIEEALASAQHRADIHLLGYLEDAQLARILGAAMALTYPSLFEGFGVPLLEAMHAEVPILTSNSSSLPEVAGDAAILVDPTDINALAQGMQRLFASSTTRNNLIDKGRVQREKFSWSKAAAVVWDNILRAQAPG